MAEQVTLCTACLCEPPRASTDIRMFTVVELTAFLADKSAVSLTTIAGDRFSQLISRLVEFAL